MPEVTWLLFIVASLVPIVTPGHAFQPEFSWQCAELRSPAAQVLQGESR
jgi:hypothetical protein